MYKLLIFSVLISVVCACTPAPDFSVVPKLTFNSVSRNTIRQSTLLPLDSIQIKFNYEDGDGDLYSKDVVNVFLIDKRQNAEASTYVIPKIPNLGKNKGISGEITLTMYAPCCLPPNGNPCEKLADFPTDKAVYQIYIKDQAGNKSNVIETTPITIQCIK